MKTFKKRLRILTSLFLILSMFLSNNTLFQNIVEAAVPDNYITELHEGDFLEGGKTYNFIGIGNDIKFMNDRFKRYDGFVFSSGTPLDDLDYIETLREQFTDAVYNDSSVQLYESLKYAHVMHDGVLTSEGTMILKVTYYEGDEPIDYFYELQSPITEMVQFVEFKLVGNSDTTKQASTDYTKVLYDFSSSFDASTAPYPLYIYLPFNDRIEENLTYGTDYGWGDGIIKITTPTLSDPNFLGWVVTKIDFRNHEYCHEDSGHDANGLHLDGTPCYDSGVVYLEPKFSDNNFVKINCYKVFNSETTSWFSFIWDTSEEFYIPEEYLTSFSDCNFVCWDKDLTSLDSTAKEIDLYGMFEPKDETSDVVNNVVQPKAGIKGQPVDDYVFLDESAVFDVEAYGSNISYEWSVITGSTYEPLPYYGSTSCACLGNYELHPNGAYHHYDDCEYNYACFSNIGTASSPLLSFDITTNSESMGTRLYPHLRNNCNLYFGTEVDTQRYPRVELAGSTEIQFEYMSDCRFTFGVRACDRSPVNYLASNSSVGSFLVYESADMDYFETASIPLYFSSEKDYYLYISRDSGKDHLNFQQFRIQNVRYRVDTLETVSTDKTLVIDPSSPYFRDGNTFRCTITTDEGVFVTKDVVLKTYNTTIGELDSLEVRYLSYIPVMLGNDFNMDYLRVYAKKGNNRYAINDFTVNDTLVTDLNNTFTVTFTHNPSLTADFNVTGSNRLVESIEAVYKGNPVYVGTNYNPNDVKLLIKYKDGYEEESSWWYYNTDVKPATYVGSIGQNIYSLVYQGMEATFEVEGYVLPIITGIEAEYKGEPLLVGQTYDTDDVEIYVLYDDGNRVAIDEMDNFDWVSSPDSTTLLQDYEIYKDYLDKYTRYDEITQTGDNTFTAGYLWGDFLFYDDFTVEGYTITGLEAEYTGTAVPIGTQHKKEDVEVKLLFSNNTSRVLNETEWSVEGGDLTVNNMGNNNPFTAVYDADTTIKDDYNVPGDLRAVSMTAEYKGQPIKVDHDYSKDDVEVIITYDNSTTRTLSSNEFKVNSQTVTQEGANPFTVYYQDLTDGIEVTGIGIRGIDAEYKGEDIPVGEEYDKSDVEVKVIYKDDSEEPLTTDDWTESGLVVNNIGDNDYTATYKTFTDDYKVIGVQPKVATHITADYKGKNIEVGKVYNKDDVLVTVYYNDSTSKVLDKSEWTESGLVVEKVGQNTYTATYNSLTDDYSVTGYKPSNPPAPSTPTSPKPEKKEVGIEAEYTGDDIKTGDPYDKKDVKVTLLYDDGSSKELDEDDWEESGLIVEKVGDNPFTAKYKDFTDDYIVPGIKIVIGLKAHYIGVPIRVGNDHLKDDVVVTLEYHDGTNEQIPSDKWEDNGLTVTQIDDNTFIAVYGSLSANYDVKGFDEDGSNPDGDPEDGTPDDGTPDDGTPDDGTPDDDTPDDNPNDTPSDTPSDTPDDNPSDTPVHTGVSNNFGLLLALLAVLVISSFILYLLKGNKEE